MDLPIDISIIAPSQIICGERQTAIDFLQSTTTSDNRQFTVLSSDPPLFQSLSSPKSDQPIKILLFNNEKGEYCITILDTTPPL